MSTLSRLIEERKAAQAAAKTKTKKKPVKTDEADLDTPSL